LERRENFIALLKEGLRFKKENKIEMLRITENRDGISLESVPICLDLLLGILLEENFFLSFQLSDLEESDCVRKIFDFLAQEKIWRILKNFVKKEILKYKAQKKSPEIIGDKVLSCMMEHVIEVFYFGLHTKQIEKNDVLYFLDTLETFIPFKEMLIRETCKKLEVFRKLTKYEPWLVLIRRKILEIEKREQGLLNGDYNFCQTCIVRILQWLCLEENRALIVWLLGFIFRETYTETKRPFLYIQGDSDLGKTFFTELLLPSTLFEKRFLSSNYFVALAKGSYELNALIFDDLGKVDGKDHHLNPEVFLNLSKQGKHSEVHLDVKYGHMTIKKGEVIIISNFEPSHMFEAKYHKAIESRLLKMQFTKYNPFPLICPSNRSRPVNFIPFLAEDFNTLSSGYQIQRKIIYKQVLTFLHF
jgi:hypothetical protein